MMDNRPIGIFDSGIGGLTVVDSISKSLPHESIHYVGDTARVPYGNKSMERVQQFSKEITQWLVNHECKIIIVACNTASSLALDFLRSEFDIPIIGVIEPGVEATLKITMNNRVGVLGTHATIRSGNYVKMLKEYDSTISVISQACPLFVPLVEEGWISGDVPENIAKTYLEKIMLSGVDTMILGCTHYPLLKDTIKKVLAGDITLVDSGNATSEKVKMVLNEERLNSDDNPNRSINCHVTDSVQSFKSLAGKFIETSITSVSYIDDF